MPSILCDKYHYLFWFSWDYYKYMLAIANYGKLLHSMVIRW